MATVCKLAYSLRRVCSDPTKLHAHLRVAFSREELTFLEGHPRFARMMKESDDSDASLRALIKAGGALIQKYYGGQRGRGLRNRRKADSSQSGRQSG